MLNITGLRPSGPFGLLERYIIYAVMAVILAFSLKKDPPLFYCFTIMGIFIFFGALAGSNLGFAQNALYLEPTIISFIISINEHKRSISKPGIYNGEMAAPQFSGTFSAGRQWIDYYTIGKRELPDYIYVDTRYYPDITMFFSTPFGQFIKDRYVEQSLEPGAEFYILKKVL